MAKSNLRLITPTAVSGTVVSETPPRPRPNRIANDMLRAGRFHLTEDEVNRMEKAALRGNRQGFRDMMAIRLAYRHGLRCAEICDLRWSQCDLAAGKIHIVRVKGSAPSVHFLSGTEIRGLRRLQRGQPAGSQFVLVSERGAPFTTAGFRKMVARLGKAAGIEIPVTVHSLRHGCGFKLASEGVDTRAIQDYLGHKSIANVVRYTRLSPERFRAFRWKD
jgi:integrase